MSRSKKGKKGCGFDYWGKRALSGNCGFGPEVKKITKKIERARSNKAVKDGQELPDKEAI